MPQPFGAAFFSMKKSLKEHYNAVEWAAHLEKSKLRRRVFRANNRDRIAMQRRESYATWDPIRKAKKAAANKRWYMQNPEKHRNKSLLYGWKKVGFSQALVTTLIEAQGGVCAICHRQFRNSKDTHADHDHASNAPRGILCSQCNTGVGKLGDNLDGLRRAVAYLENPPAKNIFL